MALNSHINSFNMFYDSNLLNHTSTIIKKYFVKNNSLLTLYIILINIAILAVVSVIVIFIVYLIIYIYYKYNIKREGRVPLDYIDNFNYQNI